MNEMPDFEQISKIVNMIKGAQTLSSLMQTETEKHNPDGELSAFDRELQSPAIRSIKAAIPYLSYNYQRGLGIIVKLMEMDLLLNKYTVLASANGTDDGKQMLMAVKAELPEKIKPTADLLIKITELTELLNIYKNSKNNFNNNFNKEELV